MRKWLWTFRLGPIKLYRLDRIGWGGTRLEVSWDTYRFHACIGTFHFLYLRKTNPIRGMSTTNQKG